MSCVDGFVAAVPVENKQAFITHARAAGEVFREHGALAIVECWEDDVPDGEVTSFPLAVRRQDGEAVVFSWVVWSDKATRDTAWQKVMEDPRMAPEQNPMPFDGKRMIYGAFTPVVEIRAEELARA